jgi:hypothetical protein
LKITFSINARLYFALQLALIDSRLRGLTAFWLTAIAIPTGLFFSKLNRIKGTGKTFFID